MSPSGPRVRDVVVIGAGPAGAVAAYLLARQGLDTVLIDRQRFPRYKVCGGCLNRDALETLTEVGLESRVRALGGVPLDRFRIAHSSGARVETPLDGGIAVDRAVLDMALVDAARSSGAQFLEGVAARVDACGPGSAATRRVALGRRDPVDARIVIAADGLGHPSLAGLPEFRSRVRRRSWIGAGAVGEGGAGSSPESGVIMMTLGRDGYVGMVRLGDGRINVAAALDPGAVGRDPDIGARVRRILGDAELDLPWEAGAVAWSGTPPLTRTSRTLASERILAIGDAASYVEPFTGEGMAWALADAVRVAALVPRYLGRWTRDAERLWAGPWSGRTFRQVPCRVLGGLLRSEPATRMGLAALGRFPGLAGVWG
jgi:flavin-dependent dehydrogenase